MAGNVRASEYVPRQVRRPAWSFVGKGGKQLAEQVPVTDEDWLRRIIGERFGFEQAELCSATRLVEYLGFDSLDFVELAMRCEDHWGFEFREDFPLEDLGTVEGCLKAIQQEVQRVNLEISAGLQSQELVTGKSQCRA